ncbi:ABC transporter permease subunit [Spirulina subsalsa FACHB-351]|uniref:ABC transporter permease subunit n=1 Tax=Spirulina subsalsa FACHB-351 TaxID=234711 RepID=A0ABT3LAP1_9CYAN|nr:ABC transporter permease subunit [Spirulina subsalsa]MCW6038561.1 ABC transporter permease subunit [Spirulina subsalsa FACHB-351]
MTTQNEANIPLWRDERFWKIAVQLIVLAIVVAIGSLLVHNVSVNMQRSGVVFGFRFLDSQASFAIGESIIPYNPAVDSYRQVMLAGLVNTLRVIVVGIILTTIVGILAGVASFSENWLLRKGSQVYVEVIRNTPLLLQLYFWYRAVFTKLPRPADRLEFLNSFYLSNRGVFLPWPTVSWNLAIWAGVVVAIAIGAFFLWRWRIYLMVEQGQSGLNQLYILWGLGIIALLIIIFPFNWQVPQEVSPGNIQGGLRLTIEYSALVTGLVVYTGAYISEIVRAGIQSVAKGQWEAARALGIHSGLTMRLVVFPQALRVMIPPLNSQYMNLAKNSSLAIAIGYADIYSVANTTYNQTGRPVEVMIIIMITYLIINLLISVVMNQFNRIAQLRER